MATGTRYLFKNAGKLFVGNVGSAGLALVTLILVARMLGPEGLGQVAVITAFVGVIGKLVNFRPVQAMIYYGVNARSEGDQFGYSRIISLGILVDVISAALGFAVIFFFTDLFITLGWADAGLKPLILINAFTILFNVSGASEAVLQIYARFGAIAIGKFLTGLSTLVFMVGSFMIDGGLSQAVISYTAGSIAGNLVLASAAIYSLRRDGVSFIAPLPLRSMSDRFPGVWGFLLTTNLNSSIRLASREADILVVDVVLGSTATGVYRAAKSFSRVVELVIQPLATVIFPMLSQNIAVNEYVRARSVAMRGSVIIGILALGLWFLCLLLGPTLIDLTIGSEFMDAQDVLVWYILALVVSAFAFPLQPIMLSFGRPYFTFWVHIISTIVYFLSLALFLQQYGLPGAGQAYLVYYISWSGMMLVTVSILLQKAMRYG